MVPLSKTKKETISQNLDFILYFILLLLFAPIGPVLIKLSDLNGFVSINENIWCYIVYSDYCKLNLSAKIL